MASSLAAQIAQSASLNTALLADRSRRKPTESYLFTSREADQQDIESIHALGVNAFARLRSLEPTLGLYEEALFSDAAKGTDRTLIPAEANTELDRALASFLPLLGPYLLEETTGKIIEWLVRRFRIHEFNVEAVLALFLPYHDAPHFTKMLSILHIEPNTTFAPLLPHKSTHTPLTHNALVNLMLQQQNSDLARFIGGLLPSVMKLPHAMRAVHRALTAMHTGILLEFVRRSFGGAGKGKTTADEAVLAWVLPAAVEPLQMCRDLQGDSSKQSSIAEVILSSYLLLSAISHTCALSAQTLNAILRAAASCASRVSAKQVVRTLASICAGQSADAMSESPLSEKIIDVLLQLPGVVEEIQESLMYAGTERFASAFGKALITRLHEEQPSSLLTGLLISPNLPRTLVQELTRDLVLLHVTSTHDEAKDDALSARTRSLLVHIQQRYPDALQAVFAETLKERKDDKDVIEQLLLSLPVALPSTQTDSDTNTSPNVDVVVASTSADSSVRMIAVRQLYEKLSTEELPVMERHAIGTALVARIQDTNVGVLEALYSAPTQLLNLLLGDISAYVDIITQVLHGTGSTSRSAVKAHFAFAVGYVYPAIVAAGKTDIAARIIDRIVFPYLLFSKPRQKTTSIVWELLEAGVGDEGSVGRCELLSGCVDAVKGEQSRDKESATKQTGDESQSTDVLARMNIAIAAKIAENIFASSVMEEYITSILRKLQDAKPHSRALAFLICRALLSRLSGGQLIDVSIRVLHAMEVKSLQGMGDFMKSTESPEVSLQDVSLSTAIVLKPTKLHTLHRLQMALLSRLPNIPRPAEITVEWLAKTDPSVRDVNACYVGLMRAVYALANSTATLPMLSTHLIRSLFVTLGDDALKFLAGVWLHSDPTTACKPSEFASLRHASAFLEAHYATQRCVDFQVVLPAILVALQHGDKRMREAALECVFVLIQLSQLQSPSSVYAFDAIYGSFSADLQYLEWADFCRYIQTLHANREQLFTDASYLAVIHQQSLATNGSDTKKESGYKQRILCYLLSHVVSCPLPVVKLRLLASLEAISNSVKYQMLQPVLEALTDESTATRMASVLGTAYEDFISLAINTLDETAVGHLNKDENFWTTYKMVLRHFYQPGVVASARQTLSKRLSSAVFAALQHERKMDLCRTVLSFGQQSDIMSDARNLLISVLNDVPVIVQLLTSLQPTTTDPSQHASKRAKLDSTGSNAVYSSLTLLAEALSGKPLPGSVELLSALLETLNKVIHDVSTSTPDKTYIEQLLMSALESTAVNVTTASGLASSTVRLDILVELIRVSENPQTFHQALLLMATLARLAPEAILRNVMPVFTFMGSNVFHRDDAYSFRVVQKTIDSIVPVMVSSLKESHKDKLDLYIASREFLRVFTDAANHIPRHRRTSFFGHLIDVLGSSDFLAPVCMLLADKMVNRVTRQNLEDSANTLALPLSVLQRYPKEIQLSTILDLLREVQRLLDLDLQPSSPAKTFLEPQQDDERANVTRRQAFALLILVSHATKQLSTTSSSLGTQSTMELLGILLDIAVSKAPRLSELAMSNISQAAAGIMEDALSIMSAKDFVNGVVRVTESGEATVQSGALNLLADQLTSVADKVRQETRASILKIIEFCRKTLSSTCPDALQESSLRVLDSIASSLNPGEEHALTTTVPVILKMVKERKSTNLALTLVLAESRKLGPRLIPYFKDIIKECVTILRAEQAGEVSSSAVGLLQSLLSSIPNFWSAAEFTQVIDLYLDSCAPSSTLQASTLSPLIKAVAKKAPSKLLLTTLCEVWLSVKPDAIPSRLQGYFSIVKKAIHVADRPVISDNLRALYKVFMESFELCAVQPSVRDLVRPDAIGAFLELVVKLNEAAFRPLFRKMFDWAFSAADDNASMQRKFVFTQIYMALVDYFKGLMTPYMSFLLQPLVEMLNGFAKSLDDTPTWLAVIQTLSKTLAQDERVFWRDEKLQQLLAPLIAQVATTAQLSTPEKTALSECLVATAEVIGDDTLLKTLNVNLLMHTRSEDIRVRIYALACSEALWRAHGDKLIGFSAETATFIAECAEDNNDSVVKEAHRLKNAVESVAGRIEA